MIWVTIRPIGGPVQKTSCGSGVSCHNAIEGTPLSATGGCHVMFLLSGEMAVAFFTVHLPRGLWTLKNARRASGFLLFLFPLSCVCGRGPWSLDALLKKKAASPD